MATFIIPNSGHYELAAPNDSFNTFVFGSAAQLATSFRVGWPGPRSVAGSVGYDVLQLDGDAERDALGQPILDDMAFFGLNGMEELRLLGAGLQYVTLGTVASAAFPAFISVSATNAIGLRLTASGLPASHALTATGTPGNDLMSGGAGNDALNGGAGLDTVSGGLGNDVFIVDSLLDVVEEADGEGTDEIRTALGTYSLVPFAYVENLTYTGAGSFKGTGNTLSNVIISGAGNDKLDGGSGADTLVGGLGNDTYMVDGLADAVVELPGQGIDTVRTTAVVYSLAALTDVENLTFIGAGNASLTGNAGNNTITGSAGDDTLDGAASADRMVGGQGSDVYWVDDAGDLVVEASNSGIDSIHTTLNAYSLAAFGAVENLRFFGVGNFSGTGNGLGNAIRGSVGDDTLNGAAGADTLAGRLGDDVYIVDSLLDVVEENAGEGIDEIRTGLGTYSLAGFAQVENLTYIGAGSFKGTGNALDNVITGGVNNDTLTGIGGIDTLVGGLGSDTYVVDSMAQVIVELPGEGTDTVRTTAAFYSLAALANVENLTYVGAGNASLTGNAGNNTITGGAGDDSLDGGAGADRLVGGAGNDTYFVDDAGDIVVEAANAGRDTIRTTLNSVSLAVFGAVEDLRFEGSGNFTGTGNARGNFIGGGAGNDSLAGAGGSDTLDGGAGDDSLSGALTGMIADGGLGYDRLTLALPNSVLTAVGRAELARLADFVAAIPPGQDGGIFYSFPLGLYMVRVEDVWISAGGALRPIAAVKGPGPVALADSYIAGRTGVLAVPAAGVLGNDTGTQLSVAPATVTKAATGSVLALAADGSFAFTPGAGAPRTETFTYTALDWLRRPATGTLTIEVVNAGPVARDDSASTFAGKPLTLSFTSLLANDSDADGDALTIGGFGNGSNGTVARVGSTLVYTPDAGFVGTDRFTYVVADPYGGTSAAYVDVTVQTLATPPAVTVVPQPGAGVPRFASFGSRSTDEFGRAGGNDDSYNPTLSADGRLIAFESLAWNIVNGSSNYSLSGLNPWRIYLTDMTQSWGLTPDLSSRNGASFAPAISGDGKRVAFESTVVTLAGTDANGNPLDTNGVGDVFVAGPGAGFPLTRVSVGAGGEQANGASYGAVLSRDGTLLVFASDASNLVAGDTNGRTDLFVKNLDTGAIHLVATPSPYLGYDLSADGRVLVYCAPSDRLMVQDLRGGSAELVIDNGFQPAISANGRYVVFAGGGPGGGQQVWWKDRFTGELKLVSAAADGTAGNGVSSDPDISGDGRFVVFGSAAGNLVAGDTNGRSDVFAKDVWTGAITRLSVGTDDLSNTPSAWRGAFAPAISEDGSTVAFAVTEFGFFRHQVFATKLDRGPGGAEDTTIALPLAIQAKAAGDLVTQVVLSGLPPGSLLSSGTPSGGGTVWSFAGPPPADLTFTPPPDWNGIVQLTIRAVAANGGTSAETVVTRPVVVMPVDDGPPVLVAPIADQQAATRAPFAFTLPVGTFADPDKGTLLLAASKADGSALPPWLSFNGATGVFSGTPKLADAGAYDIRVTATDDAYGTSSDVFRLDVALVNAAPVLAQALADETAFGDDYFQVYIPPATFFDADGEPLVLTARLADGSALPGWMHFNPYYGAMYLSGYVPLAVIGSAYDIRITATDAAGASASDVFTLSVAEYVPPPVISSVKLEGLASPGADPVRSAQINLTVELPTGGTLFVDWGDGTPMEDYAQPPGTFGFGLSRALIDPGVTAIVLKAVDGRGQQVVQTIKVAQADGVTPIGYIGGDNGIEPAIAIGVDWLGETITGGGGSDLLRGLGGDDALNGWDGDDELEGGAGNDTLTGGFGADRFVFRSPNDGADSIEDFSWQDVLVIVAEGFDAWLTPGAPVRLTGGTHPDSGDAQFTYDPDTGDLLWWGTGAWEGQRIAMLQGAPAIGTSSLLVV